MKACELIAVVAALAASPLCGATNVWTGAVNDWNWNDGGNYSLGMPGSGDVVQIPSGTTARLLGTDTGSISVVNALSRIMPMAESSRLQVETDASHDIALSCSVSYPTTVWYSREARFGEVVKKGPGELSLLNNSSATASSCLSPLQILLERGTSPTGA